jgi:guanylate kinase
LAGILFIISAPSGSGKSTLVSELRKQVSAVDFAISWTTRAPRGSERDGREYHFTTREEFLSMADAGMFLEHAEVFGSFYGTARLSLDDALAVDHDLILDIDVQGAAQVRAKMPEAVSIFVMPPNPKVCAPACATAAAPKALWTRKKCFAVSARLARRLRIIASTDIFSSMTFSTGR